MVLFAINLIDSVACLCLRFFFSLSFELKLELSFEGNAKLCCRSRSHRILWSFTPAPFGFDGASSVQWVRIVVAPVGLCLCARSPIGACSDGDRKPSLQRVGIGTPSSAEERNALGRG